MILNRDAKHDVGRLRCHVERRLRRSDEEWRNDGGQDRREARDGVQLRSPMGQAVSLSFAYAQRRGAVARLAGIGTRWGQQRSCLAAWTVLRSRRYQWC